MLRHVFKHACCKCRIPDYSASACPELIVAARDDDEDDKNNENDSDNDHANNHDNPK